MQLVEQGKLDLNADVNTYLDFRLPATYPQPITLKNLMSHTAGFENRDLGLAVPSLDARPLLEPWLAANVPAQVRPSGVEAGYSNYGAALSGYIVERVSGDPFSRYLETHLFHPLGMQRTTSDQRFPLSSPPTSRTATSTRTAPSRSGPSTCMPSGRRREVSLPRQPT
jgi:CubicO group peptidase (beta-lactamase class C family)